jgi:hypothetical protein
MRHDLNYEQCCLLLNLLEEFNCLLWQTLPAYHLQSMLPDHLHICEPGIRLSRTSVLNQIYWRESPIDDSALVDEPVSSPIGNQTGGGHRLSCQIHIIKLRK